MEMSWSRPLSAVVVVFVAAVALYLYKVLWAKPETLRRDLRRQGITGPEPAFLLGNIRDMKTEERSVVCCGGEMDGAGAGRHDYSSTIFPYFERWRKIYGNVFMFSIVSSVSLYVSDPDLVKEIGINTSLAIGKTRFSNQSFHALFGNGIIAASGNKWAIQRKIIAPEFFMDKVKGMVALMADSAIPLLKSWESKIIHGGGAIDIEIDDDFQSFAADALSKACFGNNYADGEEIFSKITMLQESIPMKSMIGRLPGSRYLPTKINRVIWRLDSEISSLIKEVARKRMESVEEEEEKDLMHSILKKAVEEGGTDESFIVDNCKNIYFAGQETIATAAKWVLLLLASNPEWQRRVREEVVEVFGDRCRPDMEKLKKLTLMTQVIQETLRLYPASPILARQLYSDIKVGNLNIAEGTCLWIPTLHFHHSLDIWGPDAAQFKPERFAKGVSGACKHPHMYMPFGFGPRTCLGQNFAMVELKVILALILSKFKFSPSPKHRHSVGLRLTLGPKHGVRIVIDKV